MMNARGSAANVLTVQNAFSKPPKCIHKHCLWHILNTVLLASALVTWCPMWGSQGAAVPASHASPSLFPAHHSNPYWAQRGPCFKYVPSGRQRLKMTKVISEAVRIAPSPVQSQKDLAPSECFTPLNRFLPLIETQTLKAHFLIPPCFSQRKTIDRIKGTNTPKTLKKTIS